MPTDPTTTKKPAAANTVNPESPEQRAQAIAKAMNVEGVKVELRQKVRPVLVIEDSSGRRTLAYINCHVRDAGFGLEIAGAVGYERATANNLTEAAKLIKRSPKMKPETAKKAAPANAAAKKTAAAAEPAATKK